MVHSMTAFARVERAGTQGTLSWELRSVNSRYLDILMRHRAARVEQRRHDAHARLRDAHRRIAQLQFRQSLRCGGIVGKRVGSDVGFGFHGIWLV